MKRSWQTLVIIDLLKRQKEWEDQIIDELVKQESDLHSDDGLLVLISFSHASPTTIQAKHLHNGLKMTYGEVC
jgi:hypothetical protein